MVEFAQEEYKDQHRRIILEKDGRRKPDDCIVVEYPRQGKRSSRNPERPPQVQDFKKEYENLVEETAELKKKYENEVADLKEKNQGLEREIYRLQQETTAGKLQQVTEARQLQQENAGTSIEELAEQWAKAGDNDQIPLLDHNELVALKLDISGEQGRLVADAFSC